MNHSNHTNVSQLITYTRKTDLKPVLENCFTVFEEDGLVAFHEAFNTNVLRHKVKFPLLEFCAHTIADRFSWADQLALYNRMVAQKTMGGNVVIGILLQRRFVDDAAEAIDLAVECIADADDWYVADLIGERVFGVGLLAQFNWMLTRIRELINHPSHWVVRSLGAGGHYAVKKGLEANHVEQLFLVLLSLGKATNYQIRQGIGWAAKTTAKFHPEIIATYRSEIDNAVKVDNWFRRKVAIGLNRYAYARQKGS